MAPDKSDIQWNDNFFLFFAVASGEVFYKIPFLHKLVTNCQPTL